MHAFIIVSKSKDVQKEQVARLLSPFAIDPVDITRIVPQNSIGISELRQLRRSILLTPYKSGVKAVIVEEAQTLTIEAQNAFLKTLEEPPDHTIIILLTNNVDALLPTIVSRCQIIELSTSGNWQLATGEQEAKSLELVAILEGKVGERLAEAEEIAKDRENTISWLSQMILTTRQKLLNEIANRHHNHLISQYRNILISLTRAHTLLATTNVNPRFTLEILFLSLS